MFRIILLCASVALIMFGLLLIKPEESYICGLIVGGIWLYAIYLFLTFKDKE